MTLTNQTSAKNYGTFHAFKVFLCVSKTFPPLHGSEWSKWLWPIRQVQKFVAPFMRLRVFFWSVSRKLSRQNAENTPYKACCLGDYTLYSGSSLYRPTVVKVKVVFKKIALGCKCTATGASRPLTGSPMGLPTVFFFFFLLPPPNMPFPEAKHNEGNLYWPGILGKPSYR